MERREQERVPLDVPVRIYVRDTNQFTQQHAINISRAGLFVRMESPPPVRTAIDLEFYLTPRGGAVRAQAEVIRSTPWLGRPGGPFGMGLRFTDIGEKARQLIEATIRKRVRDHPSASTNLPSESSENADGSTGG
ncbi:MAG: PilZ domain-containing protein [Planctomycetota bacterium]|nr:PilZ domain-containing protein [Planctomycetota bacterium]